uniref:Cullin family profile domain-containing protein n=1 Tax=Hanusia phi TaxID=3032 RepID=A0A7S0ECD9_9CRYP|mmetsp:Transcript_21526/g.48778  ORF Transcript_21526/g.48778 Transcript_21526/m.48778 type:complete len:744 (+) Transcript_21526:56-2287(+)
MSQQKKSAFVIHAFKTQPPKDANMPKRSWEKLEAAIIQIFNENAGELSFEELYRTGYNMVLHKHGDMLYNNVDATLKKRSIELCERVEKNPDETFLSSLKKIWTEYKRSLQMVQDILMYMDRTYVKQNQKKPVYDMGLGIFCQHCVRATGVRDRLRRLTLELIRRERDGEKIERDILRSISQMLQELGKSVFHQDLEKPFIESSQQYYMVQSESLITGSSTPEYLRYVEAKLSEESERVASCLSIDYNAGDSGIKQTVENELIGRHMMTLVEKEGSGLIRLLEDFRIQELKSMFDLFSRVQGGTDIIEGKVAEHVGQKGREIVMSPENQADPLQYVQQLLELKDNYDSMVKEAFRKEKSLIHKLHKAFEIFVNLNSRSPEYISLAMDTHLRGTKTKSTGPSNISEEQTESVLERTLQLFRFLHEKDMFEKYFKQHLAKRLLGDRSQSEDLEKKVIQMLKTECGYQFTAKLEGMFKDMHTSADLHQSFSRHLAQGDGNSLSLDLQVKVLTTGFWPTQPMQQCRLPPEIDHACMVFQRFYLAQHNGRQLTWQTNMGNADLKAKYDKTYQINVPTFQMVVLLLFSPEGSNQLSFKEIETGTNIPKADLERTLQSLACAHHKLLVKEPKSKNVSEGDMFFYNSKFTNRLIKFKVSTIAASKETSEEVQASRNKMNEDRNPQIDAAIVRVMKARRVMEHNLLVAEVTKQLQSRFNPNPVIIKKRIEGLIERDFLQRQTGDIKKYEYLA